MLCLLYVYSVNLLLYTFFFFFFKKKKRKSLLGLYKLLYKIIELYFFFPLEILIH